MVPRQWPYANAFLIASGPSLTREDVEAVKGRGHVLVINDCWKIAPWANALYACDLNWWAKHNGVPKFQGQKWTQCESAANTWGLNLVPGKWASGLSFDPSVIHYGSNSGFQALNLAVLFGATRIVLLGYDMQPTNGKRHWFGNHPAGMNNPDNSNFARWREAFETIDLAGTGIEVINASRESALNCFKRMTLGEVLAYA